MMDDFDITDLELTELTVEQINGEYDGWGCIGSFSSVSSAGSCASSAGCASSYSW